MDTKLLGLTIIGCGFGHIALALGSLYVPNALKWKSHLCVLNPLLRQMFWTYAGYILGINLTFGIISIFGAEELLNGSFLAKSMTLLIALYWFTRIAIQFFYFDRSQAPKGLIFTIGEVLLILLFVLFTIIYFAAFFVNKQWI